MEEGRQGAEGRLAMAEARHAELLARRERRREELQQQRALSLQGVERMTSVLVLPHPERGAAEVKRHQPGPETESTAMQVVMDHERGQGRHVEDVSTKNLGYDVTSLDTESGDLRLIEVKGLAAATGTILLTPNERRVAEDRPDCYWLYVVTNCGDRPRPGNRPGRNETFTLHRRGGAARQASGCRCGRGRDPARRLRSRVWTASMPASAAMGPAELDARLTLVRNPRDAWSA